MGHDHEDQDVRAHGGAIASAGVPDEDIPATKERYPGTDMTRRTFLVGLGATGAAALLDCNRKSGQKSGHVVQRNVDATPPLPPKPTQDKQPRPAPQPRAVAGRGHVFKATNEHALDHRGRPARQPVERMLDHLMRELVGKSSVQDCWATLFHPDDIVAIKPNAFAGQWCSPSAALMDTIIARLTAVGISPKHIFIWDHWNFAGSPLYNHLRKGPARVATQKQWGYDRTIHRIPSGKWLKFNKLIPRVTAIVNVPVFKDHDLAGVSGSMKNLAFGSIINPASHHPNCCSPSVPDIYNLPILRDKVRLIVADTFRVIYNKGPFGSKSRSYNVPYSSLFATRDPVAMDRIEWDVVDGFRKHKGLPLLMDRGHGPQNVGRPIHILHAGHIGLGESDLSSIKLSTKVMT